MYVYFLGSITFTIMGNAAGSMEVPQTTPGSTGSQNPSAKLPMPPEEELEQRFSAVLVSCALGTSHKHKGTQGKQFMKTKNLDYFGNVHVLRTSLSQCQVHNATVERYIRGPLCWSLLQHLAHCMVCWRINDRGGSDLFTIS